MRVRLLELQNEFDSLQACAAAGRLVPEPNLRGWAALLPLEPAVLAEGLRHSGLAVLQGSNAALALGSLTQLWGAGRSLADALERELPKALAAELRDRAAAVDSTPAAWTLPRAKLAQGRTLLMGIVNVAPDSFSDGGRSGEAAIEHGLRLAAEGADVLDVGGESTRPDATPVDAAEERRRTERVVRALASRAGVPVSIDTTKAEVAQAALDAGAEIVNDVSGLARDPLMGELVARAGAGLCLMHMRGTPRDMQSLAVYADLHGEVLAELSAALERAAGAGVAPERIVLDPGLGFAKTFDHNLLLLRRQRELSQLGRPLLVGPSRKAFLGRLTGRPAPERAIGTAAAAALSASAGAFMLRVHDVAHVREALAVADAVRTSGR